jgi:hypothetical protein
MVQPAVSVTKTTPRFEQVALPTAINVSFGRYEKNR